MHFVFVDRSFIINGPDLGNKVTIKKIRGLDGFWPKWFGTHKPADNLLDLFNDSDVNWIRSTWTCIKSQKTKERKKRSGKISS